MKRLLIILFCISPLIALGQTPGNPTQVNNTNYYSFQNYVGAVQGFMLPQRDTNWTPSAPALVYRPADSSLYYWKWNKWQKVGGTISSNDTSFSLYLLKTDFIDSLNNNRQTITRRNDSLFLTFGGSVSMVPDSTVFPTWFAINDSGYIKKETDPVFTSSPAYTITTLNINNWQTAYNSASTNGDTLILTSITGGVNKIPLLVSQDTTKFRETGQGYGTIKTGNAKVYGDTLAYSVDTTAISYPTSVHDSVMSFGNSHNVIVNGSSTISVTGASQPLSNNPVFSLSANNTLPLWNAVQLQGLPILNTAPSAGQILFFNGTSWAPYTLNPGSGTVTAVGMTNGYGINATSNTTNPITAAGTFTVGVDTTKISNIRGLNDSLAEINGINGWIYNTTTRTGQVDSSKYSTLNNVNNSIKIDTVQTIAQLEAYNKLPNVNLIYVADSLRGGLFYLSNYGIADSGTVFPSANGKKWVRNYNNNSGISIEWYRYSNSLSDDEVVNFAIQKNPSYSKFYFYPNKTYHIADVIVPKLMDVFEGNMDTLWRAPDTVVTLSKLINVGDSTLILSSVPPGWKAGDQIQVYGDSTAKTTPDVQCSIKEISGDTVKIYGGIYNVDGSYAPPVTNYPAGYFCRKIFSIFSSPTTNPYTPYFPILCITQPFVLKNIIFDGNKNHTANNLYYDVNQTIYMEGLGGIIDHCYFYDIPTETIYGQGFNVKDCIARRIDGDFVHFSGQDTLSYAQKYSFITNNFVDTSNIFPAAQYSGHSYGVIEQSFSGGYYIISGNRFNNALNGAVLGETLGAVDTSDASRSLLIISGNVFHNIKNGLFGSVGSPNPTNIYKNPHGVEISGNVFDSCGVFDYMSGPAYHTLWSQFPGFHVGENVMSSGTNFTLPVFNTKERYILNNDDSTVPQPANINITGRVAFNNLSSSTYSDSLLSINNGVVHKLSPLSTSNIITTGNIGVGNTFISNWKVPAVQINNSGAIFGETTGGNDVEFGSGIYYDGTNFRSINTGLRPSYLELNSGFLSLNEATNAAPNSILSLTQIFGVDSLGNATANSFVKKGGTSSQFLKANGSVDNNTYLTANQPITLSGDVTGTGTTAITTALKNTGTAGTYTRTTYDAQGRETGGTDTAYIPLGSVAAPTLHNVLAAGDTATNDIQLGSTSRVIWGSTTGGNGGQIQYTGGNFNLSTVSLANPVLIDGSNVAIGSNNGSENVGIGTISPAYKLDVSGNTRLQNNLSVAGDSLRVWNKTYSINALPVAGFLRANVSTNLNTTASYTSPSTGIDLFNNAGFLEFDNANNISFSLGSGGTIACGECGVTSLNSSGASTWIYSDPTNPISGAAGWLRVFNNANYGLLSGIAIPDAYTFTQGSYTAFSGHIDTLAQLGLYAPISGYSVSTKAGSNYGILQLSNYPNSYNGGTQEPIVTSSVGYTLTTKDFTVINTAGTNTFTMPAANTCKGQIFHLVCNTGTVTLSIGYLNYAGTNTTSIAAGSGVTIQSNGTSYYQIGQ